MPVTDVNAVELAQALIRCPSVTPEDCGALGVVAEALEAIGFTCHALEFSEPGTAPVGNLYARLGDATPNFCFAGHTDVVPVGDQAGWSVEPFGAEIAAGRLFGRGATDMKTAIACFVAAVFRFLKAREGEFSGSISLLITGDEEGPAINGTRKVLQWLAERGESLDVCLVGEPTNPSRLGEMIKIGRRGILNGRITVTGIQGHVAYPHLADNPIPRLAKIVDRLASTPIDAGTEHFQPSTLQMTTIDVGNPATNVIPATASAGFSIRYNVLHTPESLIAWLDEQISAVGGDYHLETNHTGDAFLTAPGPFSTVVAGAVRAVTGLEPELSTTGGSSDARFIKDYCPIAEFGLISQTMHKVDEQIALEDIENLTRIYTRILEGYFE